jgi:hypothetical protein
MNEPWYRQFWPWFLFGLPAIVVVAGLVTWWIAASHSDDLVVADYYKQGLAINRELDKAERARALGMTVDIYADGQFIQLTLAGNAEPDALSLYLSHPLEADRDQEYRLARLAPGLYRTRADLPEGSRWLWQLEPTGMGDTNRWRLDGELRVGHADVR